MISDLRLMIGQVELLRIPERSPLCQLRLLDLREFLQLVDDVRAHRPSFVCLLIELANGDDPAPVQVLEGGHDLLLVVLRDVVVLFIVALLPAGGLKVLVLAEVVLREHLREDIRESLLHLEIAEF